MQPASKVTAPQALPARLPKGAELDGYVVDGWVRDGGMAAIYRARRVSDGVRVALKLQLPSTTHLPEICRRFDREAEAMRRVTGALHVVELHHTGVLEDGRRYFMMEWVEGENLEERLDSLRNDDKRLPVQDVCELGLDIAKGLATVHEHELVHRDLKPSNVMVGRGGDDALLVKLVDFGIVADLRPGSGGAPDEDDAHEQVMGTSAYMAPEQASGQPPTPAMDVFALGVMLYEALTGTCVPPDGWTPESLPAIESQRRNVVPELAALVRACMSSEVARRPRTGSEVASQLVVILGKLKAKGARLDPSEVPIRTGGTVVMPRSQIVALEHAVVRTGETEVALTHAQVLTISGSSHAPVQPSPGASVVVAVPEAGASTVVPVQPGSMSVAPSVSVAAAAPEAKTSAAASVQPASASTVAASTSVATKPEANAGVAAPEKPASASAKTVVPEVSASVATPMQPASMSAKAAAALQPVSTTPVVPVQPPSPAATVPKASVAGSAHPAGAVVPVKPSSTNAALQSASMVPVQPPSAAASVSKASTSVLVPVQPASASVAGPALEAKGAVEDEDEDEDALPKRRWPLVVALLVPVVATASWVVTGKRVEDVASEAPVMVIPRAIEHQEVDEPAPEQELDEPAPTLSHDSTEEEPAPDATSKSLKKRRSTASGESAASDAPPRVRPPTGPDTAACEQQRADAIAAKARRDWQGLLEATRRTKCWRGSFGADRQRLRVTAHAELNDFARCVKEGGNSPDPQIVRRVNWCRGKALEREEMSGGD